MKQRLWSWQEFSLALVQWHIQEVGCLLLWRIDARVSLPWSVSHSLVCRLVLFCQMGLGLPYRTVQWESWAIKGNQLRLICQNLNCPHVEKQKSLAPLSGLNKDFQTYWATLTQVCVRSNPAPSAQMSSSSAGSVSFTGQWTRKTLDTWNTY